LNPEPFIEEAILQLFPLLTLSAVTEGDADTNTQRVKDSDLLNEQ